jgi:hypothetical protein
LPVGAGEAQFRRGDTDLVVEVEQAAGFNDRENRAGGRAPATFYQVPPV